MTLQLKFEQSKATSHSDIWRHHIPNRGDSNEILQAKGCLACCMKGQEVSVPGVVGARGPVMAYEVREVTEGQMVWSLANHGKDFEFYSKKRRHDRL